MVANGWLLAAIYAAAFESQLEPPGFLALNYGRRTPLALVLAHLLYGGILGAFCRLR